MEALWFGPVSFKNNHYRFGGGGVGCVTPISVSRLGWQGYATDATQSQWDKSNWTERDPQCTFPDLHRQAYAIGSHSDLKAGLLIDPSEACCEIWSDSSFFRLLRAQQRVISIPLLRSLHHYELLYISFDSFIQSITSRTKFPLFSIKTPSLIKKRAGET